MSLLLLQYFNFKQSAGHKVLSNCSILTNLKIFDLFNFLLTTKNQTLSRLSILINIILIDSKVIWIFFIAFKKLTWLLVNLGVLVSIFILSWLDLLLFEINNYIRWFLSVVTVVSGITFWTHESLITLFTFACFVCNWLDEFSPQLLIILMKLGCHNIKFFFEAQHFLKKKETTLKRQPHLILQTNILSKCL